MTPSQPSNRADSRGRVLDVLRSSTVPLGVAAVAAATGLSANAVRFHLEHLRAAGAVRAAKDPDHAGPGRPALLYSALPADAVEPEAAYRMLAGLLARQLSRSAAAGAPAEAGRDWAGSIADGQLADAGRPGDRFDVADVVDVVRQLFERTGFQPRVGADGRSIELNRCPFLDLAIQQPDVVCGVHGGLVTGLLDAIDSPREVRLEPVLDGTGPCVVRISGEHPARPRPTSPAPTQEHLS